MRLLSLISFFILLVSCADTNFKSNYYYSTVQSWRGGNIDLLLRRWGRPEQKITTFNGNQAYIYRYRFHGNDLNRITWQNKSQPAFKPNQVICMTVFEVNAQKEIVHIKVQGHGCFGSKLFSEEKSNPATIIPTANTNVAH